VAKRIKSLGGDPLKTHKMPLVLMADDDDDDCTLAKEAFEASLALGMIHCVEDGIELLKYLSSSAPLPALILLDLNMPRKDGRQILKELKSTPAFQSIPVVVFTTSRDQKDITYSRKMGAKSFITKPSTFVEWIEVMRSLADTWLVTN
jgi:CheY-like chemotaxis protein